MKRRLVLAMALLSANVVAQAPPGADVWLAGIENGLPTAPARISDGDGYNNQPRFSADGKVIWYTREMPGENGPQTDVAAFDITTSLTTMITNSAESEYSPTPIPGREALSVVRVEADQKQRLWSVELESGAMELLFSLIEPVGYHAWLSENEAAMFILGDTFTLQLAGSGEEKPAVVAENIGRSLRKHPASGEVLFVDKNTTPWSIAGYDPKTGATRTVVPLFPDSEDFTVDSAGGYWTGNGSKLYRLSPGGKRWELMADFSAHGIRNISRLDVHLESGQIALVSD